MSKISVIIVSYNEKDYLLKAYKSVRNQTHKDIEIIIGDDGSDDGSIELIKRIEKKDSDVSHFVMERNESEDVIPSIRVSNVLKKGLEKSTGDYIVLLSGDDWFCDIHKLEDAAHFLDENEDYFSYVSGYKMVYPDSEKKVIPFVINNKFFWSRYIHISAFVFRRPNKKYLLDRFLDDSGFVYTLCLSGKIKSSDSITFAYRRRKGSIVHTLDSLESDICEVMMIQDILNLRKRTGMYITSTGAREFLPLARCIINRKKITNDKYSKYMRSCSCFDNNILKKVAYSYQNYSLMKKMSIWAMIIKYGLAKTIYMFFYQCCCIGLKISRVTLKFE